MTPEALADYFREKLGEKVTDTTVTYGQLTVTVEPAALPDVARFCKEDPDLDFAFFDFMSGVDRADDGFEVITHLYSVQHGHHVTLKALAEGGRESPKLPSITDVYRGANWHEREAYDMFGVEFEGHPGLLPRILTVENFEGFPLRKDFLLTTREAKPWPGLKEPADAAPAEDGGEAAADSGASAEEQAKAAEDKAKAAKEKTERAKRKAAEMRAKKARERAEQEGQVADQPAADEQPGDAEAPEPEDTQPEGEASGGARGEDPPQADLDAPDEPIEVAEAAGTDIAKDAAAGAVAGDTAEGATQDEPGVDEPVEDPEAEQRAAEGAPAEPGASPGVTAPASDQGPDDSPSSAMPPARPKPAASSSEGEPVESTDTPRALRPEARERPVAPAHSPAADVESDAKEDFEPADADEPEDAPGTDHADRRDIDTAADREDGDKTT